MNKQKCLHCGKPYGAMIERIDDAGHIAIIHCCKNPCKDPSMRGLRYLENPYKLHTGSYMDKR